jgi:hypothetical protein
MAMGAKWSDEVWSLRVSLFWVSYNFHRVFVKTLAYAVNYSWRATVTFYNLMWHCFWVGTSYCSCVSNARSHKTLF